MSAPDRSPEPFELTLELFALQQQQRDAREYATYMGMSSKEKQDYERRALRITELQRILGVKPEVRVEPW